MKKQLYTFVGAMLMTTLAFAQNVEFKSSNFKDDKDGYKAAVDAIKEGDDYREAGMEKIFEIKDPGYDFYLAAQYYMKAQKFNPNNGELNFKLGASLIHTNRKYEAPEYLLKAQELDPECDPFVPYYVGMAHHLNGNYDEALKFYKKFENDYRKADNFATFVKKRKEEARSAKELQANPIRAWVDNVKELNSPDDDFGPTVTTDGAQILFTSNRKNSHDPNAQGEYDMEIYVSNYNNGKWDSPKPMQGAINSPEDDIASNLSYDGTKMLMFRRVGDNYDVLESELEGRKWSEPVSMSRNINTSVNQTFASYNFDDVKIYYLSDKEVGSASGNDIYFSGVIDRQTRRYGSASGAGKEINSKFNEGSIYLHPDGETMYFSSEGHNSMGGMDIFVSYKKRGQWTAPINLGYPINTPYDDIFFAATASNKFAYIASNRPGGEGELDLYKVTFWGPPKPVIVDTEDFLIASAGEPIQDKQIKSAVAVERKSLTVFKGKTIDAITRKPVEAEIEIVDNEKGTQVKDLTTNSATGKFLISLNSGRNYGIAVKADGYLFHSENFDIPDGSAYNLVDKTIELKNIKVGSKIALRNIFFATGSAELRSESDKELDRLVKLLEDVPALKVEISGHTDNTGSATLNEKLSQERAEAVVKYLVDEGISKSRLKAKGYGSSRPVASNDSSEGRQQNRRTEFEIIAN